MKLFKERTYLIENTELGDIWHTTSGGDTALGGDTASGGVTLQ